MAEVLHSVADITTQVFLIVGIVHSRRKLHQRLVTRIRFPIPGCVAEHLSPTAAAACQSSLSAV